MRSRKFRDVMDEMQERKRAKEIDALREIKDGGINSEWHLSQRE